ncbi:MAG: hypothetical protein J5I98_19120, partial [Phaeodactylibacter sp.]|nr:hypothetical protein [Phaeodactylibacter sp.]
RACLEVVILAAKPSFWNLSLPFFRPVALLWGGKMPSREPKIWVFRFKSTTSKHTLRGKGLHGRMVILLYGYIAG